MTKQIFKSMAAGLLMIPLFIGFSAQAATPNWDAEGEYVVAFEYQGLDYAHDVTLVQDNNGNLTGNGGHPAGGAHVYTWVIATGTVSGDTIQFTANYTASADAVTPLTTMHVVGTIDSDGDMSGTWTDNYQGGSRAGTWSTTEGQAIEIVEPTPTEPTEKNQCKDGGWKTFTTPVFKNQGQCVAFVASK